MFIEMGLGLRIKEKNNDRYREYGRVGNKNGDTLYSMDYLNDTTISHFDKKK